MKERFEDKLNELNIQGYYPFHMPGHKRNMSFGYDAYKLDITEIDGYDDLHHPEGMIKELEERVSKLYGSYKSYVLVNGSTCGILAAITAVTSYGDGIIMARNSHKSAYNTVGLRGLYAEYIYPEYIECPGINGAITGDSLKKAIDNVKNNCTTVNDNIAAYNYTAVYITSPTYEGIVSDIKVIADIVHKNGMILIVDEAHGAHFGVCEYFPDTAVRQGADIVIQSIHKTLPGMTQTAILHVNEGRVDIDKLEYYLSVYQSSSPSYVLMSSVDNAIHMIESRGDELFKEYYERLGRFYKKCGELIHIKLYNQEIYSECPQQEWRNSVDSIEEDGDKTNIGVDNKGPYESKKNSVAMHIHNKFDFGKLVIYEKNDMLTGREIYDYLREKHKLQLEMASGRYCLAMTSICDTDEGMDRLFVALKELDKEITDYISSEKHVAKVVNGDGHLDERSQEEKVNNYSVCFGQRKNNAVLTIEEAIKHDKVSKVMEQGLICAEYIYVYPPGIPMIVPGEIVKNEHICDIMKCVERGFDVRGVEITEKGIKVNAVCL